MAALVGSAGRISNPTNMPSSQNGADRRNSKPKKMRGDDCMYNSPTAHN